MKGPWKEGVIGVPDKDGNMTGVWYEAKVYDTPSEYGINGGRISKLELRVGRRFRNRTIARGTVVARYDRGWDIEPLTDAARAALEILLFSYK